MSQPKTLADILPPDNPLRLAPYWDSPDGRNVNAIACLEWLEAFLTVMNKELPCGENDETHWHVCRALKCQLDRIERRKQQGVFGTNKPHECTPLRVLDDIA